MTLRGLLWGFGAAEQDEAGQVTINSPAAVEAVRLMATIYRESMIPDVFMWDAASNNRAFVWGQASIIQNPISAIRSMEKSNPELAKHVVLAPPAAGPAATPDAGERAPLLRGLEVLRQDRARQALPGRPGGGLRRGIPRERVLQPSVLPAGGARPLPEARRGQRDRPVPKGRARRRPPHRYALLAEADRWSALPGHPGPVTPAIDETLQRGVIPAMFARAARGEQTPEASVRAAEAEMRRIFARWNR